MESAVIRISANEQKNGSECSNSIQYSSVKHRGTQPAAAADIGKLPESAAKAVSHTDTGTGFVSIVIIMS